MSTENLISVGNEAPNGAAEPWSLSDEDFRQAVANGAYVPSWAQRPKPEHTLTDQERYEARNCKDIDTNVFFAPANSRGAPKERYEKSAAEFCVGCTYKTLCLEEALQRREPHGVWGGLTSSQREALLSKSA